MLIVHRISTLYRFASMALAALLVFAGACPTSARAEETKATAPAAAAADAPTAAAADSQGNPSEKKAAPDFSKVAPYPLSVCATGETSLKDIARPKRFVIDGRELMTCCAKCRAKIEAEPQKYLKEIDKKIKAQQAASYPLDRCVAMDKPVKEGDRELFIDNHYIRLCCAKCVRRVEENPRKYVKLIDSAIIARDSKAYPLATDPVSGKPLGEKPVELVYAGRLVRFENEASVKEFRINPSRYSDAIFAAYGGDAAKSAAPAAAAAGKAADSAPKEAMDVEMKAESAGEDAVKAAKKERKQADKAKAKTEEKAASESEKASPAIDPATGKPRRGFSPLNTGASGSSGS